MVTHHERGLRAKEEHRLDATHPPWALPNGQPLLCGSRSWHKCNSGTKVSSNLLLTEHHPRSHLLQNSGRLNGLTPSCPVPRIALLIRKKHHACQNPQSSCPRGCLSWTGFVGLGMLIRNSPEDTTWNALPTQKLLFLLLLLLLSAKKSAQ
jgi:hypothetical protein